MSYYPIFDNLLTASACFHNPFRYKILIASACWLFWYNISAEIIGFPYFSNKKALFRIVYEKYSWLIVAAIKQAFKQSISLLDCINSLHAAILSYINISLVPWLLGSIYLNYIFSQCRLSFSVEMKLICYYWFALGNKLDAFTANYIKFSLFGCFFSKVLSLIPSFYLVILFESLFLSFSLLLLSGVYKLRFDL